MSRRHMLTLGALIGLALAGCTPGGTPAHSHKSASARGGSGTPAATAAAGTIGLGSGPQSHYIVEPQPAHGGCHYGTRGGQPMPDPACTPGALNPDVTQATLSTTVCRPGGYTSTIRPPASITGREKAANAASYGFTGPIRDAEYDHLISLSLGGDPNDPRNLWVEPPSPGHRPGAGPNNDKDKVETKLHTAVCSGRISLAAAQRAIATDWPGALAALGLS